ncbi:hypothetical protein RJ639_041639, partial [Escallonia herrerae]
MQDFIGSVRRSLVFKPSSSAAEADADGPSFGGFVEKIGSTIRRSRIGLFSKPPLPALPPVPKIAAIKSRKDDAPPIRWRKGELIGCGAFGRVYMGMNLDSGELLAVKQVSIAVNSASKEKTQAHIRELEEEVKLLKNLSHPNIVRYLGTAREEESLNILLEFVPGGSISSLLGKFGSFPESVIRMYAKQLLLGLEYLHKNGIMHRDIKGANILVDNKGCIRLADFGASKKVVELATMTGAKSMKGTPYWMAPEATMTGAKSMKGTPYWMAPEVILQTGHSLLSLSCLYEFLSSADIWSVGCTIIEMATGKPPWSQQYQESFNPMSEPNDDWPCKFDESPELDRSARNLITGQAAAKPGGIPGAAGNGDEDFTFPNGPSAVEDDDEVTESKIRAFLDEKAVDLKKLQSPLYEEFYNSLNVSGPPSALETENKENVSTNMNLPPKSRSPSRMPSRRYSAAIDVTCIASPGALPKRSSNAGLKSDQTMQEVLSPQREWKDVLDSRREPISP